MQSRSNHRNYSGKLIALVVSILLYFLYFLYSLFSLLPAVAQAQAVIQDGDTYSIHGPFSPGFQITTNDKTTQVSATVPDTIAPSTPVLIAPVDGAISTDSTPTFVWKESSDNVAVTDYTFYLDGVIYTSDIPINSFSNAAYTLVFDSSTGEYSLTHIGGMTDGNHTWKISAQDAAGNTSSSTTWSFLIDTQSPTFIITAVGSQATSISAQDVSTVPTKPIELTDNKPLLSGTGEANSAVVLQLRRPGSSEILETISFVISSDGTWEIQLGTLERDVMYNLTFQITDQAGLLSIVENVPLIIKEYAIEIPVPGGLLPIDNPIVIPIPVIPAEIVTRTIHVTELTITKFSNSIFASSSSQSSSTRILSPLWYTHLMVLLLLLFLPMIKFVLLALPFGRNYSLNIGASIWRAILGYPNTNKESMAINDADQGIVPYLTVRLVPINHTADTRVFLSDENGYLPPMTHLDGLYLLRASLDEKLVPYSKLQPTHLEWEDWYRGQSINLKASNSMSPVVLPVPNEVIRNTRGRLKKWILKRPIDSLTTVVFATLIIMVTPTIGNFITLIAYGGFWMFQSWRMRMTNCRITTATTSKVLLPRTVIRLKDEGESKSAALYQTNQIGEALIQIKNGSYKCEAIHHEYRQKTLNLIEMKDDSEISTIMILTPILA
ncbi:hypothetical protein KA012_00625 [Candidatus Woesebacteria bacterium]|nr:hypothetical protein [Candidatus Woesebacteria bacterium]